MKIKHIILSILLCLCLLPTKAQNTNTMYFMDEIAERNNLNPAFTPNCDFYFDFIFLPNLYFGVGNDNFIIRDFIYNQNGKTTTFLNSNESINKFYNNLNPTSNINFNLNLNVLSFGFQVKKHYFTFDMGVQADIATYVPRDIFKLALYGTPDADGINSFDFRQLGVDASVYSNVGIGYMYKINEQWTIGAKAKFLMGAANVNTDINKLNLYASRKEWNLVTDGRINASLPISFNTNEDGSIDFGSIQLHNTNDLISILYKPAGYGAAIDLGVKYEPIKNLIISASITDLGFIYWNRNTLSASIQGSHKIDGLIDYTVGDSLSTDAIVDNLTNLGEEILGTIHSDGENNPYTTMLRANFFVGAEYGILKNKISFGAVNRLRFKNTHLQDEFTLAVNFRPLHWLKASVSHSFINGRFGTLGLGLNLRVGMMNMYLIADYIPTSYAKINLGSNGESMANQNLTIPNRAQMFNLQMGWSWNLGRHANDPDRDGVKRRKDKCPDTDMDFLRQQCPGLKKKQYVDKYGCDRDEDKDGVHDCYDKCPETPLGVVVDSIGCPVDTDKDGIADYLDVCPETPENVAVTENGCPVDSDNDGVADYLDMCPGTPSEIDVDAHGCPVDTDEDGVADYIDLCPNTPAGVVTDENGCPTDADKDGVSDYIDKCPNTPIGAIVDEFGCPTDTDKDGVLDYLDKCPNTPEGIIVNEYGCPFDTDGDGVADYLDKCPNTPEGIMVNEFGCSLDSDNDGVYDNIDKCPNTPEGVMVNEYGCPLDSDNDGVFDTEDKCPNTPGTASNQGCPELKKEVRNLFTKAMTGIQFESGKNIIKESSYPILDQIVSVMELNQEYHLTISGHTDNAGDDNKNMQLSIDRAAAVGEYLKEKGIDEDRLTTTGFGETKPIADNNTAKGRAKNRRVEFEISFEEITYEKIVNPELQQIEE